MNKVDWGVIIAAVGLLGTLIGFVVQLGTKLGRSMEALETLRNQFKDEKNHTHEKFNDLYKFKSDTEKTLSTIDERTLNIQTMLQEIKAEIKGVKKIE